MVTELRAVQLVCNHTRTPATRSSDFVNHSYDYRLNWTLISPVNITYLHIIYLLFLIFANKKQLAVLLALIFALHRASSDSLATDLVAYTPAAPPPPYSCKCSFLLIPCARFSAPNPKFKMFISLLKTAQFLKDYLKNLIWFIQAVVLYNFSWSVSHPTPTLYPVCVVLSVNQSVSQPIVLISSSVGN